jgi:RNA polymerase-binding transcription factor DksA
VEAALLAERARMQEDLGRFSDSAGQPRERSGDLSEFPLHPADLGSDAQQQELDAQLGGSESERLLEIEQALERLRDHPEAFGRCEVCGREIGAERLAVVPETRFCAEHALRLDASRDA